MTKVLSAEPRDLKDDEIAKADLNKIDYHIAKGIILRSKTCEMRKVRERLDNCLHQENKKSKNMC